MRVSVVVPVYNPGPYLEACVASVLDQTMPMGDLELILVDDGSTDDSPARLDALAAAHEHVRVFHEPGSGWAGRPRNVGVREARGEYVQLLDQDDWLGPEAMERMYAAAVRNRSDVVLGKVAGTMQAPNTVYLRNVESSTVLTGPAMESLTPHKMFRRDFLLEHDIWHPEGRVRLEDQLFMIEVYLQAEVITVVADYPCYYWMRRDDGGNTSTLTALTDPKELFPHIHGLLRLTTRETEPGAVRDAVMSRTLRQELLRKVSERPMLVLPESHTRSTLEEVEGVIADYYGPPSGPMDRLAPLWRLRARLAAAGSWDGLHDLATRLDRDVRPRVRTLDKQVVDGRLEVHVSAQLVHADGRPVTVVRRHEGYVLDPRWTDGLPGLDGHDLVVPDPAEHVRLDVRVDDPEAQTAWFAPVETVASLEPVPASDDDEAGYAVVLDSRVSIDPTTLGPGLPAGGYDVRVRFQVLGAGATTHPRTPRGRPLRLLVGDDGRARRARATRPATVPGPPPPSGTERVARAVARRLPARVRPVARRVARLARRSWSRPRV